MKDKVLTIDGLSREQMAIADVIWSCESIDHMNRLCEHAGSKWIAIRDLLIATVLDEVETVEAAKIAIQDILDNPPQ